jgi:uncharacterized Zn-binding protein involved in type VI secretion
MPGIAKVGDIVSCTCCCHPPIPCLGTVGFIITGASSVLVNGSPAARVGDIAICACGHPTFIVGGAANVTAEGIGVARIGDPVSACPVGTIITGSGNVTNG